MCTIKRTSLPLVLILLGVLACAVPEIALVDPNASGTSVAATVGAIIQLTQDAANNIDVLSSDTPTTAFTASYTPVPNTATFTPPPTFTPTFTLTPTAIVTVTPFVPMISVSVPTNCRVGPGKVYEMVGALLVGEVVQVYARDPSGNYWYIRNPDEPANFCWVWGNYATLSGITSVLPVFTPPPSPTPTLTSTPSPGFEASYEGLDTCVGWWADILVDNTGLITFKSVSMTITDTVTSTAVTGMGDGFTDNTGCSSTFRKALLPEKHAIASSPQFGYDPAGHKLKATITLCSDTGLNGICVTQSITFKP